MNRTLILLISILSIFPILSQTTIPYQLKRQIGGKEVLNDKDIFLFVTINEKICYDSDINGFSVDNGVLRKTASGDTYDVFEGESYCGEAIYRFKHDLSVLNVVDVASNIIYVFSRCVPPNGIHTCSFVKKLGNNDTKRISPDGSISFPPSDTSGSTYVPTTRPEKRRCMTCDGKGNIKVFVGTKAYTSESVTTYICPECKETMYPYDKHIHQTCPTCYGKGYYY